MTIDDPKIAKAIELLQAHERTAQACADFLKAEGKEVFTSESVALKMWMANRLATLPLPSEESAPTAPAL